MAANSVSGNFARSTLLVGDRRSGRRACFGRACFDTHVVQIRRSAGSDPARFRPRRRRDGTEPDLRRARLRDIVFLLAGRVAGSRFPPTCPDDRRGDYRSGTEYELHAAVLDRPAPGRLVFVHHPHSQGSSFDATQSGERLAGHLADLLETWLTGSGAPAADSYFAAEDGSTRSAKWRDNCP